MAVGSIGAIVFEASEEVQRTFSDLKRQAKARFSAHDVIGRKPVQQHVGSALDNVSLKIRLDARFINPRQQIESLRSLLELGDEQLLVIGGKPLGSFLLLDMDEQWLKLDGKGRLLLANVSLKLREYAA